ncbi:MAG: ribosome recycling factor, partial [Actinobacteria bacterium]|nr:ribosome recycling factor [Actinomycetota bacterium]
NPSNDGNLIRINIPPLTEERRKELVKRAKAEGEQGRRPVLGEPAVADVGALRVLHRE